jgi:Flp pilus assembly protein TadD
MRRRMTTTVVLAWLALLGGVAGCTAKSGHTPTVSAPAVSQNDPAALLNQGIRQGNAGDFQGAIASFKRIIVLSPKNKFAWFNLGVIAQTQSHKDEAIKDYDQALVADPKFTSAMYNKAILLESSNVDSAIGLYRQILTINKTASSSYLRLGLLLDQKGDHAGATDNFRSAIALDASLISAVPSSYQAKVRGQ